MAAAAAVLTGIWAHKTIPDTPASWFILAGLAAMLTYAARKLIVVLAGLAGLIVVFANKDEAEQKADRPAVPAAVTAAPAPRPAAAAERPAAVPAKVRVIGFCVVNDLPQPAHYTLTLPGFSEGDREMIAPGEVRHGWEREDSFQTRPTIIQMTLEGAVDRYDLPLGSYDAARFGASESPTCGDGGLPVYAIRAGKAGLQVWVR